MAQRSARTADIVEGDRLGVKGATPAGSNASAGRATPRRRHGSRIARLEFGDIGCILDGGREVLAHSSIYPTWKPNSRKTSRIRPAKATTLAMSARACFECHQRLKAARNVEILAGTFGRSSQQKEKSEAPLFICPTNSGWSSTALRTFHTPVSPKSTISQKISF